jgi:probable phosphoglycerate mutase
MGIASVGGKGQEIKGPDVSAISTFPAMRNSIAIPAPLQSPPMTFPDIILIRHGQTEFNREGRIQGHGNSVLTELGQAQAAAYGRLLAERFAPLTPFALYRSPAGRCEQTTALACAAAGLDPRAFTIDERLKEKGYGRWEGMTRPEIATAGDEADLGAMDADPWGHRPPGGGETLTEVMERAHGWLLSLAPTQPVIVVCHGGTGRTLIRRYLGLDAQETMDISMRQDVVFHLSARGLDVIETGADMIQLNFD